MKSFEAWGGPLDGSMRTVQDSCDQSPVMGPRISGGTICSYTLGFYRPPAPGTNATNADGLPIWHWYASE